MSTPTPSRASTPSAPYDVAVTHDIVYGHGRVGHGTPSAGTRPLTLELYAPVGVAPGARLPAIVFSHGGAYHRGDKRRDEFEQDGAHNTPVHAYCERYAARGYVCVSVGYRLTQELPGPADRPTRRHRGAVPRGRIDYVRGLLGLPPATDAELLEGVEAVNEDVSDAFRFVLAQADAWGIDPARMAIGGFSAGAFASVYASFALGVPAAAVICLSGGMEAEDAEWYVHGTRGQPPLLMFVGEHDLPGIPERTRSLVDRALTRGLGVRRYAVPGKGHFYEGDSPVVLERSSLPGGERAATVETAMTDFLETTLRAPAVDVAMLEAFAQAWNRHDIDALMSFMSEDCVFHGWIGGDASGARHVGREAVRAAFARAWADFPDAQWTRARHAVCGNRGMSEWTFLGTRASDGARVEVDGCDLFTFSGDRIRVKDSWRKQRVSG